MKLLAWTLGLCLALTLSLAAPSHHQGQHDTGDAPVDHGKHPHHDDHDHGHDHDHSHDHDHDHDHDHGHGHQEHPKGHDERCKGIEFDAVTVNEEGMLYFFKGEKLYKGSHTEGELANKTFHELDDQHHIGHVDAAFHMHSEHSKDHHEQHDHQFFFLDNKVFCYDKGTLEAGYPKDISEVFPGIPDHLDASVECPKPDCHDDSVIFFKGHKVYHFDINTKKVDEKELQTMPNCTAAFRYMGHYYCLHGNKFSKFDPIIMSVHGKYPKDIRGYFIRCPHFVNKTADEHTEREQCSRAHLDSITEEDDGDLFAFRDHHFLSVVNHTFHADEIEKIFKGVHSDVDAVYSHEGHIHIIKGDKVFAHTVVHTPGQPFEPMKGYPKTLQEELGITGPVDAAFICPNKNTVYIIKGKELFEVDPKATPPKVEKPKPITTFKKIDTAMCGPKGVTVVVGSYFYKYESPMLMLVSKIMPVKHDIAKELFGCDHYTHKKH
ncbi:hemopexin [Brachyhypopomus gauderio]|uniref:hemopexin n=1 Tax=Brachyhypopomus gauderio TaxID=698409 RepID=UPI004043313C